MIRLVVLLLATGVHTFAETHFGSDLHVLGQTAVGTSLPRARLEIQSQPSDLYALQISSQNGAPLCSIDRLGRFSAGASSALSRVEVQGVGDSGDIGLQLRAGNSSTTVDSVQITFSAPDGDLFRHNIRTSHVSSQYVGNAITFYLWNSSLTPTSLGSSAVLGIQAITAASSIAVHVDPVGVPDVELEVSNSSTTGGGRIHRYSSLTPSSRSIKSDIAYLSEAESEAALADVTALAHARFRYRADGPTGPIHRGLIYEDTPASIRGTGDTIVINNRIANLELALKAIDRRIHETEMRIGELERKKADRGHGSPNRRR